MLMKPMTADDFTCLLCGSRLGLKFGDLILGENRGSCPMCQEPFIIKLDREDMEHLIEAEENRSSKHHR